MTDPPRTATTPRRPPAGIGDRPARRGQHGRGAERRRALEAVASEVADQRVPTGEAAFAFASYDDGFLAMAISGVVDDRSAERLAGVLRDVRTLGRHELDIDFTGLVLSTLALMRFLGHLRLQQVANGGRIELHHPPADLVNALGENFPDELSLHCARPALRAL